jgi:hypothetical protein
MYIVCNHALTASMHNTKEGDKGIHPLFKCGVSNQARWATIQEPEDAIKDTGNSSRRAMRRRHRYMGSGGLWMSPFAMASDVELMPVASTGNGAPPAPPVS